MNPISEIKSVTALEKDNQIAVTIGENNQTIYLEIKVENCSAKLSKISDENKIVGNSTRFEGMPNEFSGKVLTVEKRGTAW